MNTNIPKMWVKRVFVAIGAVLTPMMYAAAGRFVVPAALCLVLARSVQAQPAAPASLTALSGNAQVFLQWPASSGATSYNIYRAPTNRAYALINTVTATSYTDSTVANGVGYYYVVAALGGGRGGANSPEAAAIPLAPGYHRFINRLSGMALDNPNGIGSGGVDQQPYGGINQLWSLVPLGGGVFASLDAKGTALSGQTPSAQLTMNPYLGASYQFWTFQVTNDTYYLVRNLYTGQVLDDFGGSTSGGTAVGQWAPNGGDNQNWIVTQPLPQLSAAITNNGNYAQYRFTGQVDPNHLDTTVICELGASASYGYYATNFIAGTNTGAVGFTNVITIPQPSSFIPTWHAAVTASNLAGSVSTGDTAMAAAVTQLSAVALTNAAPLPQYVFSGVLNPAGLDTTVICQLGTNTAYGLSVTNFIAATNGPVSFAFALPFAADRVTTLHGQVTVQNLLGSATSADLTNNSVSFELTVGSQLPNQIIMFGLDYLGADNVVWADMNDDGNLDLANLGISIGNARSSSGGVLMNPGPTGGGVWHGVTGGPFCGPDGFIVAGDFDNDNRADTVWAGSCGGSAPGYGSSWWFVYGIAATPFIPGEYRSFYRAGLLENPFFNHPRAVAADFDHDGKQDLLITDHRFNIFGSVDYGDFNQVLRNHVKAGQQLGMTGCDYLNTPVNNGSFINNADATGGEYGGAVLAGGFLTNNGFMDIYAYDPTFPQATIYRNDGDLGFGVAGNLPGVGNGRGGNYGPSGDISDLWGGADCVSADFNGDGFDDLLVAESSLASQRVRILLNDGHGHFTNSNWVLPQWGKVNFAVGDLFNHGRNDIVMTGWYGESIDTTPRIVVLRNDGNGVFTPVDCGLYPRIQWGNHGIALGDYDRDGRLDIAIAGYNSQGAIISTDSNSLSVYRNEMNIVSNQPPTAPGGLGSVVSVGRVDLQWGGATDDLTPTNDLTYNIRIGSAPLGTDVCSPLANVTNGWRKIADRGNVGHCLGTWYKLPPGTYYWSVQAIDGAFAGGAWAAEQTFTITAADQPELSFFGDTTNSLLWSSRFTGYHLEQTADLGSGMWSTNSNQVLDSFNGKWRVTVSNAPGSSMFYRLRK